MAKNEAVVIQQQQQDPCPTCPDGTACEDTDLLCINIPCVTTVVLLGAIQLNIAPLCIRVGSVGNLANLSDQEKLTQVQNVFTALRNTLPNFTA